MVDFVLLSVAELKVMLQQGIAEGYCAVPQA